MDPVCGARRRYALNLPSGGAMSSFSTRAPFSKSCGAAVVAETFEAVLGGVEARRIGRRRGPAAWAGGEAAKRTDLAAITQPTTEVCPPRCQNRH